MNRTAIRKASFAVVTAAACIVPLAVHAQAAATKGAPTPPAPTTAQAPSAPAPAPTPPVTPEARTLVKELLELTNVRDGLTKTFQSMSQTLPFQMNNAMVRQIDVAPGLTPEQKNKVRDGMPQPFEAAVREAIGIVTDPKLVDQTIEKMIPVYAKYYTVPELKQLIAFFKTPVGAKSLTATPQANNESLQAVSGIFQPRLNALMEKTLKTQVDLATKK